MPRYDELVRLLAMLAECRAMLATLTKQVNQAEKLAWQVSGFDAPAQASGAEDDAASSLRQAYQKKRKLSSSTEELGGNEPTAAGSKPEDLDTLIGEPAAASAKPEELAAFDDTFIS